MNTISVTVQHISLESLRDAGWEMGDGGQGVRQIEGNLLKGDLLAVLTPTQRKVAYCLNSRGMTREETALHLMVSTQAIHQIVLRMRRRLMKRAGIKPVTKRWFRLEDYQRKGE